MAQFFPSLISANLLKLQEEIALLEPYVTGFHIDVMDFHFVPNLTWGPPFINEIRAATKKQLFVHLMVDYPEKYLDRMKLHEQDIVSVHFECKSDKGIIAILKELKARGWTASIALNPGTSITSLAGLTGDHVTFDHVLLMTVEPGFSGQEFIGDMFEKLKNLAAFRTQQGLSFPIAVDGGVNQDNVQELIRLGADQFAIASAIFNYPDRIATLKKFPTNY